MSRQPSSPPRPEAGPPVAIVGLVLSGADFADAALPDGRKGWVDEADVGLVDPAAPLGRVGDQG